MLDNSTVKECRERNGGQKIDRPSRIDDVMGRDRLGQDNGDPIADGYESYSQYPTRNDLSDPSTRDFLCELFSHPLVSNWQDVMDEFTGMSGIERRKSKRILQRVVDLFEIDVDARFEEGEPPQESRLTEILDEEPAEPMISPSNPMLVGQMYALGMSVREITDVLADHVDTVNEKVVRNSLKQAALVPGEPSNADKTGSVPLEEEDVRLGGTTVSTVETDDVKQRAKDIDGVTVR
jgi:hypothetical protein